MMESTFENVARKPREKNATKSDDAEVPKYHWEEHLLNNVDPKKNRYSTLDGHTKENYANDHVGFSQN
jgi:hypothetical protein